MSTWRRVTKVIRGFARSEPVVSIRRVSCAKTLKLVETQRSSAERSSPNTNRSRFRQSGRCALAVLASRTVTLKSQVGPAHEGLVQRGAEQ
jgi:hypothetical protein